MNVFSFFPYHVETIFLMAFTAGFYSANTQSRNTHGHHDFDDIDRSRYECENT